MSWRLSHLALRGGLCPILTLSASSASLPGPAFEQGTEASSTAPGKEANFGLEGSKYFRSLVIGGEGEAHTEGSLLESCDVSVTCFDC